METEHNLAFKDKDIFVCPTHSLQYRVFDSPNFNSKRNRKSLIKFHKQNHETANQQNFLKITKSSTLEIQLALKLLNDSKNWNNLQSIQSSYFNKLNLSDHWLISRHLKKYSSDVDRQLFYNVILLSKESENISLASSNSATILNKIGFSFDNKDFKNVKIPYADLSRGSFIKTDFSNSDLTYADFTSSAVLFSDFSNCKMNECTLNEMTLKPKEKVFGRKFAISKCEKYAAIFNKDWNDSSDISYSINLFSVYHAKKINELILEDKIDVKNLQFSASSQRLYILYKNAKLLIWNFWDNSVIIKFEDIEAYDSIINETVLVYSKLHSIWALSLITFELLWKSWEKSNCELTGLSEKYLICKYLYKLNKILSVESESQYEFIDAERVYIRNDIYFKEYQSEFGLWKVSGDEPLWKINSFYLPPLFFNDKYLFFLSNSFYMLDYHNQNFAKLLIPDTPLSTLFISGWFTSKKPSKILKPDYLNKKFNFKIFNPSVIKMTDSIITIFQSGILKEININTKKITKSFVLTYDKIYNWAYSEDLLAIGVQNIDYYVEVWHIKIQSLIIKVKIDYLCENIQISWEKNQFSLANKNKKLIDIYSIDSGKIIQSVNFGLLWSCYVFAGDWVAAGLLNDTMGIWEQKESKCECILKGMRIEEITCSPCKKLVALWVNNLGSEIYILNIESKKLTLLNCEKAIYYWSFSQCGCFLASSDKLNVYLFETSSGNEIGRTNKSFGIIKSIYYSKSGSFIVSITEDGLMWIWNIENCFKSDKRTESITLFGVFKLESYVNAFKENNLSGVNYLGIEKDY